MSIKNWPISERPREKLLRAGESALSDAELLAIFLRTGVAGSSAVDLARAVLKEYGSLSSLLHADKQRVCSSFGLGPATYAQLQAVLEMSRRVLIHEVSDKTDALTSPDKVRDYLALKIRHRAHEVFVCLFLDNTHRVIDVQEMFRGSLSSASVYPREVVKACLAINAAAVIFAHNHPSGVANPSEADIKLTKELQAALGLVEVRVLDHLIVGDGAPTSLAERGLLN